MRISSAITVDPGVNGCGVAIWDHGKLRQAIYLPAVDAVQKPFAAVLAVRLHLLWPKATYAVVVERPQVYALGKSKGDPNDLIQVALVAGGVGALLGHVCNAAVFFVTPAEWKGQLPKPASVKQPYIVAERARERLTPEERACVELPKAGKLQWDVWDAVGIGLHHLGRWPR